jgi:membrane-associated phospholipid phosphatase
LITLVGAAIIFVLFPTDLGFSRVIPTDFPFNVIFENIHNLDKPHNLVPSLHVTFSALAFFAVVEMHRSKKWLHAILAVWMMGIAASVIFTRQHHVLDIAGGLLLAFLGIRFFYLRREVIQDPKLANQQQENA